MKMNIYENIPNKLSEELCEEIAKFKNVKIERIISRGQESDWYDQDEDEWVCLLRGEAEIEYSDGTIQKLHAGDTLFIPAHKEHRVAYTSTEPECIWLCVFAL